MYKEHSTQHRWALNKRCFMSFLQQLFAEHLLCAIVLGPVPDGHYSALYNAASVESAVRTQPSL